VLHFLNYSTKRLTAFRVDVQEVRDKGFLAIGK
jgi:hypothetical protein